MENDDEQQEPRSSIDPALVLQVIILTKDVNANLDGLIKHTGKLIVRQNILVGLCLLTVFCMAGLLVAGYRAQKAQNLITRQMALMSFHYLDIETVKKALGQDLVEIERSIGITDQEDVVDQEDAGVK